jgi:ABC-type sugar transport system ATPase subunit
MVDPRMASTALLTVGQANKGYNGVPALIDVSLDLLAGEVHAVIGENGAGKSTLIKLLAGVLPADAMQLTVHGTPTTIHNAQAAHDLGLRFIHQELNVIPQLSVAENMYLSEPYPRRAGLFVDWRKLNRAARAALDQLGITHISPQSVIARLRPGDQMLVKIASAFVGSERASIFVMDEPTAALTGEEADRLFNLIGRLRERGCAVLYVSHRLDEIARLADRVTILRDGRVVATRLRHESTRDDLIQLMTGRELQQIYPPRQSPVGERVVLDVRNVSTETVGGVSFELRSGEILGIAGLIGSGRTELVRALMGVDRVVAGEIVLEGQALSRRSPVASWRRGIAYVPEERRSQGLILSRSVAQNVTLPHLGRVSKGGLFLDNRLERRITEALGDSVRLKTKGVRQAVRQLSGGNQQKVLFARALARTPRILLLDEPTRGVDVGAKYDIYALLRETSAQGIGIILVSSELAELIGLCDRILIMRDGRLVDTVTAAGLTEPELLALCYGEQRRAS